MYNILEYNISDDDFIKKIENIKYFGNQLLDSQKHFKIVNKIMSRKRKRESNNDIIKIRCYHCNLDITKLFNNGKLHLHKCPKVIFN